MVSKDVEEVLIKGSVLRYAFRDVVGEEVFGRLKKVGEEAIEAKIVDGVLIDLSSVKHFSSSVRHNLLDFLQEQSTVKFAFFGGDEFVQSVVSLVISATDSSRVCLVQNEEML